MAPLDLAALARTEQADSLPAGFEARKLAKGHLLSTPDSARDQVFIVRTGRLRVYLAGGSRELSLCFLEPGDIYTTHTPTYVRTVTATTLWMTDTKSFARKLAMDPGATPTLMRVLGRLLANTVDLVADLAFHEVPSRLARFLVGLAQRRGEVSAEGWRVPMDLSMEEIASLLGSTRQTVSSLINQWEREGLLQREGRRRLFIPSLDALARLCPPK